jgi:uncharacterized membrane protein YozB (DUF420 family)
MNSVVMTDRVARTARSPFYLVFSLVMAATIIAGFSTTVPDDFAAKPALPILLHIHGIVFTLWVLLFVAQPAFIVRGSIRLHRKIGWAGAVLAVAMLAMALAATILAIRSKSYPSFFPPQIFLTMNVIGILVFAGLVTAGIMLRKQADWHRRLMICATVSILGPGVGRLLPMDAFGRAAPMVMFAVIALYAFAGPVHDLLARRRIHPAYAWGVATILISMAITGPVAFSPLGTAFLRWVTLA